MPVASIFEFNGMRNSSGGGGGDGQVTEPRVQIMGVILVISLFAVSFPEASRVIPFLRIPRILFFIGKHFGTGVILATAFIHLLQDSFESLQKGPVKEHFDGIGRFTGLIILGSLLTIFVIEYLCTSYVDHLHAEASLPPTPVPSRPPSRQDSRQTITTESQQQRTSTDESSPLLHFRYRSTPHAIPPHHTHSYHLHHHHSHHSLLPLINTQDAVSAVPIEVLTNSPRIIKVRGCTCIIDHPCACAASVLGTHSHTPAISREPSSYLGSSGILTRSRLVEDEEDEDEEDQIEGGGLRNSMITTTSGSEAWPTIGRKRQVIGLLVLQLGIMIHSLVIGLTLAITTGADFTSLTTAVIFHQLFEGLSLGIRIAALPPPHSKDKNPDHDTTRHNQRVNHSFWKKVLVRIGGGKRSGKALLLKCVLAISFAITTPAGMAIGMVAFEVGKKKEGIELARMYLTQGLMSAISAGMLIYVSTVEMIAGDFVFGDVDGHGHGHGHGHELLPSSATTTTIQDEERAAAAPWSSRKSSAAAAVGSNLAASSRSAQLESQDVDEEVPKQEDHHEHVDHRHHGKINKKVLAVASLFAGVGCMVLLALQE